ncbi:MAG: VIT1/CCC1 transporter family protein [Nanoarchaeota archaeon]|nr:VIT1/CCC1 transporter family protein [Nanoarchaeota archaeon]MBU1631768.1 VIT1/CCC1 transporter family protein [Nanoarchaeota archaeon]MBU1876168.1 VIT1/CCC1 transporter family protein [Nanoarchaeota archaeon]
MTFFEETKNLVRDFVFGMQDGLVSNLGLVLGVWQGGGGKFAIILAGLASMFAGAFSMSAGSYLSAKSQREVYEREIKVTKDEIKKNPEKFIKEMRIILKKEKFDKNEIDAMCNHFLRHNESTFIKNYIQKKLGLSEERFDMPVKNAFTMFLSFLAGSVFPISPFFFFSNGIAAMVATILTIAAFFIVGVIKTIYTKQNWFRSGIEIFIIGIVAGIIGYLVGFFTNLLVY